MNSCVSADAFEAAVEASPAPKATLNHRRRKVAEYRLQQHYGVSWGTAETLSCVPDVAVPSMGWLIVFLLIQCLRLKWKKKKAFHPKASHYTARCSAVCWKVARRVHKVYRRRKYALVRKVFRLYLWYIVLRYIINGKVHRLKMRCKKKLKLIFDRCKLGYVNVTFSIYRHIPPMRVSAAVIFLGLLMSGNVELNPGPKQSQLTVDDLKDIISKIHDARCKWENIGLQLNIKKSDLDAIDKECRGNTQKCLTEMLTLWLRQGCSPNTWDTLISVLKNPTVDFQQLAEVIESKEVHTAEQSTSEVGIQTECPKQETENGKQLYKCGCKNCPNKVEVGCSNPIPVNDTFPQISTIESLSEDERELLKARLRRESKKIMVSFHKLLSSFYVSLTTRKVPVKQLVTHLKIIKAFDRVSKHPQTPLVQEHCDMLDKATDIEGVIEVIEIYSSFFNYEVLEHMIEHNGSAKDQERMQKYKEEFLFYSRRRIYECPSYTGCGKKKGHVDMILKLDSKYDAYALEALQEFCITLAKLFHITPETLHLCKIEEGCIRLTFQIPNFVHKAIFPLTAEQEHDLVELGIVQLTCSDYHFPRQYYCQEDGVDSYPDDDGDRSPPSGTVMEVARGSHYHVINKRSTVEASSTRRHMTATDYLISAHLNAQQHYRSMQLMSVQKHQRTSRKTSSTVAVIPSLPYSRASNYLSHDICGKEDNSYIQNELEVEIEDKMEEWNKAKRKYEESDSDSAIGTSRMSTTKSDYTEV